MPVQLQPLTPSHFSPPHLLDSHHNLCLFFSLSLSLTGYINDERTNLKFTKKRDKYYYPPFKIKPNAVSSAALAQDIAAPQNVLLCFFIIIFLHSQSSSVVVRVVLHCAKLNVRVARSEKKYLNTQQPVTKKKKDKKKEDPTMRNSSML